MNIVTGIIVYVIIWWVLIFMILPIGVNSTEKPRDGMAWGHPSNIKLAKKCLLTTVLSGILWLGVYTLTQSHLFNFRWHPHDPAFTAKT